MFEEDRLTVGGSKFVAVHGVFVRLFSPPDENPSSAVIFDVDHLFLLTYTASKCELTVKCLSEHVGVNGSVVVEKPLPLLHLSTSKSSLMRHSIHV